MTAEAQSALGDLRTKYHEQLRAAAWYTDANDIPSNADRGSLSSVRIATSMLAETTKREGTVAGQTKGGTFESATREFLQYAFEHLQHVRPGRWTYDLNKSISAFNQYEHLTVLSTFLENLQRGDASDSAKDVRAAFARDYLIKPDIVVAREPLTDQTVNQQEVVVRPDEQMATHTPLRAVNSGTPILHASVSCKWTLRSDRAQNARTEALNLIRNRKGNAPHIVVVTGEPLPSRLVSLGFGTGDIDCVYHMALYELTKAVTQSGNDTEQDLLDTLVRGDRLRDISDLPFDLAI